ncbi:hypothetical protein [Novosphingobium sp.]|uniref:hypothetical protein n=1 Tax=Novosphingobium sp. TaxID=1874826 RepID=UPI0027362102|nr:hypothetical protein [Novosphingobium sp.]MDP3906732.1 hypothetical protein [Novosphingobium sp.]
MKAKSLLFLRLGTGLLLIIWGLVRVVEPGMGAHVSEKYYSGIGAAHTVQLAWGAALLAIGVLTVLGLWRRWVYLAQAVVLVSGALSIWKYLLDPFGMWLLTRETSQILFFPSLTVAAASLVLFAFRDEDTISLDSWRAGRRGL